MTPPEQDATLFGRNLCLERRRRGLSSAQLAERSGLSREGIWKIEMGVSSPKLVTVLALTDGLGVEPSKLFQGLRP